MTFETCLQQALADGSIKENRFQEAAGVYRDIFNELVAKGMSEREAIEAASRQATEFVSYEKAEQKKRTLRMLQTRQRLEQEFQAHINEEGGNLDVIAVEKMERIQNLYERRRGQLHAMIEPLIRKYSPKAAGTTKPKAGLRNIVRELYGESTGDTAASEMAKSFADVAEFARKLFNRNGSLPKRDNWRLPQRQSRVAVAKAGRDKWIEQHMRWLDWDQMRDPVTGRTVPPDQRFRVLTDVYNTLKTDGASKLEPSGVVARAGVGNKIDSHRFLVYRDSESWLAMHEEYGEGTVFDAMVGHLDSMARNIALMDELGPNPVAMKEWIRQRVMQRAGDLDAADPSPAEKAINTQKVDKRLKEMDEIYDMLRHANTAAAESAFAYTMAGTRNILASSMLGSASLLAIPGDMFTMGITAKFNGFARSVPLGQYLKLMNPASEADRSLAIRSGLVAESATSLAYGQQRFVGDVLGPGWTRRVADTVMRASLLSPHTQAARWAFGMEFFGTLSDYAGKSLSDLPKGFQAMFKRHGISEADWELLRTTPQYDHQGAKFLRPDDIMKRTDIGPERAMEVADSFMLMLMQETDYAVPTASMRARNLWVGRTRPGTLVGEIARSAALFKNFPVTILFTHVRRGLMQKSFAGKAAYLAAFGAGMTMMGAMGLQARQIAQGKDPMDMTKPEFWGSAALSGGGMGIWGDFLFSDVNRFGGGLQMTLAGPVADVANDFRNLTVGNLVQLAKGEETNFGPDLIRFAKSVAPGSNIWYSRLALERYVWDYLLEETDPKARQKMIRKERNLKRDYDQRYWWRPGQKSPDRPPDLEAAIDE